MSRASRAPAALLWLSAALLLAGETRANAADNLLRIPLENFDQMQFFGLVRVGSPPQSFQVIFDTGSSDVWLPGSACGVCAGERRYDAQASATHEAMAEPFHLEYGSGNASGDVMRERLLLGPDTNADTDASLALELAGVRMGSVTATTKRLQRFQADGIVGLGLESLALITKPGLFRSARAVVTRDGERRTQQEDAHLLARFSMYINPLPGALPSSQLIFGGVDESLPLAAVSGVGSGSGSLAPNAATVTWHRFPAVPYPSGSKALGFWAIRMTQFTVGKAVSSTGSVSTSRLRRSSPPVANGNQELDDAGDEPDKLEDEAVAIVDVRGRARDAIAIIDSGTSLLLLPREMFDHVLRVMTRHLQSRHDVQLVPHSRAVSGVACWTCSPDQFPPLTFAFAKETLGPRQRLTLQGADYVRCDDRVCSPQLDVHSLFPSTSPRTSDDRNDDVVILGVMFMRAYYTLFDVERRAVSFACVSPSRESQGEDCPGGQHPPLQFHSAFLSDCVRWQFGWIFWSRLYLSIGMALLAVAALLLWMTLTMSTSEVEKAFVWFAGASKCSLGRPKSIVGSIDVVSASEAASSASEPSLEDRHEADTVHTAACIDEDWRGKPARRKSVSFDV